MAPTTLVRLVITGAGKLIVKLKTRVPEPVALEAPNVTLEIAATVGVPEIAPEEVLSVSPAGKPVAA